MDIVETNSGLLLRIDTRVYSLDVLHKAFYWYSGKFEVDIRLESDNEASVSLTPRDGQGELTPDLISKIRRDLVDFKTRDIISRETQTVRELLIAKAFAHSDDFLEEPPGQISDPVGFTVLT